jgi:hypothetical protein
VALPALRCGRAIFPMIMSRLMRAIVAKDALSYSIHPNSFPFKGESDSEGVTGKWIGVGDDWLTLSPHPHPSPPLEGDGIVKRFFNPVIPFSTKLAPSPLQGSGFNPRSHNGFFGFKRLVRKL